jgi:hypothetical protein
LRFIRRYDPALFPHFVNDTGVNRRWRACEHVQNSPRVYTTWFIRSKKGSSLLTITTKPRMKQFLPWLDQHNQVYYFCLPYTLLAAPHKRNRQHPAAHPPNDDLPGTIRRSHLFCNQRIDDAT